MVPRGWTRDSRAWARAASALALLAVATIAPPAAEASGAFGFPARLNIPEIAGSASPDVALGAGELSDSAAVFERVTPGASTITFLLYGPNDPSCDLPPVFTQVVAYPAVGSPTVESAGFEPVMAGVYRWVAAYSGDDVSNDPVSTACDDPAQATIVSKAVPVLIAAASSRGALGSVTLTDEATVTGRVSPLGTETVGFRLYGPAAPTCAGTPVFETVAIPYPLGGGAVSSTPPFTPTAAGTYRWVVLYSGDANNVPVSTACGPANATIVDPGGAVAVADTDGDGVADGTDNCPTTANPTQADTDGDRIGDACDPAGTPGDRDSDGVPDATDNCPDLANASQSDQDADAVGDACESLPSGAVAPVAGVNAVVKVLEGEVYVKLPASAAARAHTPRVAAGDEPGYIPLKGRASVPIGSEVDTRAGRVSVSTSASYPGQPRTTQSATFAAGIFQIKQARKRPKPSAPKKPTTDIELVTPSGATAVCGRVAALTRSNAIVRSLSAVLKGRYRARGAVSYATVTNATLVVKDRCDGTITQVGRGVATVYDRGRRATRKVRAGRAYLARGRTFDNPLKGRR